MLIVPPPAPPYRFLPQREPPALRRIPGSGSTGPQPAFRDRNVASSFRLRAMQPGQNRPRRTGCTGRSPALFLGQCRVPQEGSVRGQFSSVRSKPRRLLSERLPNDLRRRGDVVRCKLVMVVYSSSHNNGWTRFGIEMRFITRCSCEGGDIPLWKGGGKGSCAGRFGEGWEGMGVPAFRNVPPIPNASPLFKNLVPPPSAPCPPRRRWLPRTGRKSR